MIFSAGNYRLDILDFLKDIISIPSMNGDEGKVIGRIRYEMVRLGYEEVFSDRMGNIFGKIGNGKKVIVIDGHADTVSPGNIQNWKDDPYSAIEKDGYIYGRGSSDQKGGIAAAVYAGKLLKENGIPSNVTLYVCASVLEEDYEGLSWQYIIKKKKIMPDAVILTEPTDGGIRIGQRGRMEMKVTVTGISCHGSAPERGENAIYKVLPIANDIEQLNENLKNHKFLGKGTVTVTNISSEAPSLCAIPDSAVLHLDRRLILGETAESAMNEVKELPSFKAADASISVPKYKVVSHSGHKEPCTAFFPAWLIDQDHELVSIGKKAFTEVYGREAEVKPWVFSTNGVSTMGVHNIPTIGFGPGEEKEAHAPNEKVRSEDVVQAASFYVQLVNIWAE